MSECLLMKPDRQSTPHLYLIHHMDLEETPSLWTRSTLERIPKYVDQFLINNLDYAVRRSTQSLILSLYKKGNLKEKIFLLNQIASKVPLTTGGGKTSEQLLDLIGNIVSLKDESVSSQQNQILSLVHSSMTKTFHTWLESPRFSYFCFCENILDNQDSFKPYLYELNGCMKCYRVVENVITPTPKPIDEIAEETKFVGNKIQFTLKGTYIIKEFTFKLQLRETPKSITYNVLIRDNNGALVKKGAVNPIHTMEFVTNFIQVQVEGMKVGRCLSCAKNEESSILCVSCRKLLDIQLKYKVMGSSNEKIMKEMAQTYKEVSSIRKRSYDFFESISKKKTIKSAPVDINEAERLYGKVMMNLNLLGDVSQKEIRQYKAVAGKTLCPSCLYYEVHSFLSLLDNFALLQELARSNKGFVVEIHQYLYAIYLDRELPKSVDSKISSILGTIRYIIYSQKDAQTLGTLVSLDQQPRKKPQFGIYRQFFLNFKAMRHNAIQDLQVEEEIRKYATRSNLTNEEKMTLAVIYLTKEEDMPLMRKETLITSEDAKGVIPASLENAKEAISTLSLDTNQLLDMEASNELILLLKYLPSELVPTSGAETVNEFLLPFLRFKMPEIPKEIPIVYSPQPIIPLNVFESLPFIAKGLSAEESAHLAQQILRFKKLWNFSLYNTLEFCDAILEREDKQRQLFMYLKGLSAIEDNYFLDKVYALLVPKRKQFTIKVELPEKNIKNYYKKYNFHYDYPQIKQKEIRTENLGSTMKDVYDWILGQMMVPMATDLIIQGKIIDDLTVPIEMVHKKLYPKTDDKPTSDVIRVIYRIRGAFDDEGAEDKLAPLGDDQLEECLSRAPIVTQNFNRDVSQCGIDILFKIFKSTRHRPEMMPTRRAILHILEIIFKSEVVRMKTIERNYVDLLIRETLNFLALKDEDLAKDKEIMLEVVERLIDQANNFMEVNLRKQSERKGSEAMDIEDDRTLETANKNVNLLLEKISEYDSTGKTKHTTPLIKLLPFSSKDVSEISERLFNYFSPLETYQGKNKEKLDRLLTFIEAVPRSYVTFRNLCYARKFSATVLNSLATVLPMVDSITSEVIAQNESRLTVDLSILKNTLQSCELLQQEIQARGLIPIIHKLSTTSSQSKVVLIADEIIKNLADKSFVIEEIADQAQTLIASYVEEKRKRAAASRANRLQIERKKRDLAAQNAFKNVPPTVTVDNQKYQHLKCVVCKSSYESGNSILGTYVYCSRSEIYGMDKWWVDPKKVNSTTCVSFFTVIHLECHKNAQVYDNEQKQAEWEGAQKRNADSKCNCWLPIRGPNNTDEEYERAARKYFQINKGVGFWIPLNDLKGLLQRFGNQDNLAKDSKGSASSNAKLICVQMALISSFARKADNFKQVMEGFWILKDRDVENFELLCLFLTCLLFVVPHKDFASFRKLCFEKIVRYASKTPQLSFTNARPLLTILGMISDIFKVIHTKLDSGKELLAGMEEYISKNLEVVEEFETVATAYKNNWLKKTTIEEFQADLIS